MDFLSVVIPVFNEEKRLSHTFSEIILFIQQKLFTQFEIIFVNDGSTDITETLIIDFIKRVQIEYPLGFFKIISYRKNKGKGYAVTQGMNQAQGEYVLMADADMSTSLLEITKFIPAMRRRIPVIIGTRKGLGATLIKHQPWYREKMGEVYALLARLITSLAIKDFGCGFKVFSQEAARQIFSQLTTRGWIFDTEALYVAKKFNYSIEEIGISWRNDPQTRVHIFTDMFTSVFDLIFMRFKHRSL